MPSILKLGNVIGGAGVGGAVPYTTTKSILLDGVDEYVNIDDVQTSLASTTAGTLSAWVKPVDATPATTEVFVGFGDTDANSRIQMYITTAGKFGALLANAGTFQWQLETNSAVFSNNTWEHVAVVQDGTSPVIYVDGSAVAQSFVVSTDKTQWFNDIAGLDNGRIGSTDWNSNGNLLFFNGNIDDVLFTSDDKSAGEVSTIYNSGTPKDERLISNGVSYFWMGDNPSDNYNSSVSNEWRFIDAIGGNNADSVNCEEADVETDTP